jgi:hypothetical protein
LDGKGESLLGERVFLTDGKGESFLGEGDFLAAASAFRIISVDAVVLVFVDGK